MQTVGRDGSGGGEDVGDSRSIIPKKQLKEIKANKSAGRGAPQEETRKIEGVT